MEASRERILHYREVAKIVTDFSKKLCWSEKNPNTIFKLPKEKKNSYSILGKKKSFKHKIEVSLF